MKTELLKYIPGLRSTFREIERLRSRIDGLKAQREELRKARDEAEAAAGKPAGGASAERERRIGWISDDVPFNVVDRSIFISMAQRYLYVETPKAGCSSVKLSLARLELSQPDLELDSDGVHQRELLPLLKPSQLPNIRDLVQGEKPLRRFVFVRNPYSRVLSAYLNLVRDAHPGRHKILAAAGSDALENAGTIGFEDFLEAVANQPVSLMDPHWRPQVHQCFFATIPFDFIGRFESLARDLPRCIPALETGEYIGRHSPHATSASAKLAQFYTPRALELANRIYEEDFAKLDYRILESLPEDPEQIAELLPASC